MDTALTVVHISASLFLIVIVLLQHGKGADLGAALGGSSQSVLGAGGAATFLSKVTIVAAVTFMVSSLGLAYMSSQSGKKSLLAEEEKPAVAAEVTPAEGATPAATPTEAPKEEPEGSKEIPAPK